MQSESCAKITTRIDYLNIANYNKRAGRPVQFVFVFYQRQYAKIPSDANVYTDIFDNAIIMYECVRYSASVTFSWHFLYH